MVSLKYRYGLKAFAPASIGNLAVGFDILGMAIEQPGDEIMLKPSEEPGLRIVGIHGAKGKLPKEVKHNTAGVAALAVMQALGFQGGLEMTLYKNLPIGSGLGSSAASAVAGAVAVNAILGSPFEKRELLPFAVEGERVASGSPHADNVAPSLLGGLILCRGQEIERIYTPPGLLCIVVHPDIQILTKDARAVLPEKIHLSKAIEQWGNAAGLVLGMMNSNMALIKSCLNDGVIEPHRASLIPGFYDVKKAAMKNGALGCSISGAGPSIFALCENTLIGENVAKAMSAVFDNLKIENQVFASKVNNEGARVL